MTTGAVADTSPTLEHGTSGPSTSIRIGGGFAIAGGVLALAGNALAPRFNQDQDVDVYEAVARSSRLVPANLILITAVVLVAAGLWTVATTMRAGRGAELARLGAGAAVVGGSIAVVELSVETYAYPTARAELPLGRCGGPARRLLGHRVARPSQRGLVLDMDLGLLGTRAAADRGCDGEEPGLRCLDCDHWPRRWCPVLGGRGRRPRTRGPDVACTTVRRRVRARDGLGDRRRDLAASRCTHNRLNLMASRARLTTHRIEGTA